MHAKQVLKFWAMFPFSIQFILNQSIIIDYKDELLLNRHFLLYLFVIYSSCRWCVYYVCIGQRTAFGSQFSPSTM